MKKLTSLVAATALILGAAAPASAGGWIETYNAKSNTPAAKAQRLKEACNYTPVNGDNDSFEMVAQRNCLEWKRTGVPDSDVRVGIVAVGLLAGAVAGGALVTTPAIVGQSGAFTIFGVTPTLIQGAVGGAVVGGALAGAGAALSK